MLTINTQIPTAVRGQVRALVKAHNDWPNFIKSRNIVSATAKNSELLEFALQHQDLALKIEAILNLTWIDAQAIETTTEELVMPETPETVQSTFNLDGIFSGVDQFLAPLVRDTLAKALQPVIDAANKPAVEVERVVEVERIVEVAPGEAPRIVLPKAKRDKRTTFRALFPTRAKDTYLDAPLTLWTNVASPAVDPFYVVERAQMAMLMTAIERGTNVWLAGPAGTGKSTMPEQACAALGRPFTKIGMTRQTEIEALVGGQGLRNGATIWEDGALIKAMRCPGMVILVDELTLAPAGVQAIFQLVADDHRSITLPTGEVVKAADGVVFVVADNTTGCGDEGGLYAGTNVSNAALVTRFKRMIIVDYLPAAKEAEALANHTRCALAAARHLADFVAQARRLPAMQGVVMSLRQMVGFVQCVQDGFSARDAFVSAISSRMPATERACVEALADLTWSATFEALIHNTPVPATPSDSAAAKTFSDEQF